MSISRRKFIGGIVAGTAALSGIPRAARANSNNLEPEAAVPPAPKPLFTEREDGIILPPALRQGSKVGIVAPASGISRREIQDGVTAVESFGCEVVLGKSIYKRNGYLAAGDADRAGEFMEFIERDDIDGILCARGGYGAMRILPMLDFNLIRQKPKIVVGYSDITVLVNAIYRCSGVVSFHGPVAYSTFDHFTKEYFYKTLFTSSPVGEIADSKEFDSITFSERRMVTLYEGTATGRLVGGNLTMIVSTLGTPYEIQTEGRILFLEDISEEPYKIDRMLTQLWLAGKLQKCAGIAIGRFKNCEKSRNPSFNFPYSLEEVLKTRIQSLKIPAVYGLPIGHIRSKMTVPVGTLATLDSGTGTLAILEPSVTL